MVIFVDLWPRRLSAQAERMPAGGRCAGQSRAFASAQQRQRIQRHVDLPEVAVGGADERREIWSSTAAAGSAE